MGRRSDFQCSHSYSVRIDRRRITFAIAIQQTLDRVLGQCIAAFL
jgi:hypothetical protein